VKLKPRPKGLDKPIATKIIRRMSTANTWLYRKTSGRLGKTWRMGSALRRGVPICLLTTTGSKSGQPRTVPLVYLREGERVVLVASQGGLPNNPMWYGNIVKNPKVEIQVGRHKRAMLARPADAEERAALWPRLVDMYADFASYQSWTDREIPVVICEPTTEEAQS
jgi:deazaflavin-dependent oxidoreductase (nitroreductase family)